MRAHFIGIKGVGISALAKIYSQRGYTVTGSDIKEDFITKPLLDSIRGLKISDFNTKNVYHCDKIIISNAYTEKNNSEAKECVKHNFKTLTYPEAVADVLNSMKKRSLCIAGCKGKTTTSALLQTLMKGTKQLGGFIIGAPYQNNEANAGLAKGGYFIIEADEYKNAYFNYSPCAKGIIITNIFFDHPDFFPSFADTKKSFAKFINLSPKDTYILICGDFADSKDFAKRIKRKFETYGLNAGNLWRAVNITENQKGIGFSVLYRGKIYKNFSAGLYGKHNIQNVLAAIVMAIKLGVPVSTIRKNLLNFPGTKRRFEVYFENKEIAVIDDYAHHPEAISPFLEAVRQKYPSRTIIAVFQPHTFSRTKALYKEFAKSLAGADEIILTEIYGSARENREDFNFNSEIIGNELQRFKKKAEIIKSDQLINYFKKRNLKNTAIVCMGAGDLWVKFAAPFSNYLKKA